VYTSILIGTHWTLSRRRVDSQSNDRYISSSMTLPPPRSTLFPYTTLFRSGIEARLARNRMYWEGPQLDRPDERPYALHRNGFAGDRKSTRLNSSHRTISYAVFCLKKKKKRNKNYKYQSVETSTMNTRERTK